MANEGIAPTDSNPKIVDTWCSSDGESDGSARDKQKKKEVDEESPNDDDDNENDCDYSSSDSSSSSSSSFWDDEEEEDTNFPSDQSKDFSSCDTSSAHANTKRCVRSEDSILSTSITNNVNRASPLFSGPASSEGPRSASLVEYDALPCRKEGVHQRRGRAFVNERERASSTKSGTTSDGDGTDSKKFHSSTSTTKRKSKRHSKRRRRQEDYYEETLWEEAVSSLKECCPRAFSSNLGFAFVIACWVVCQIFLYYILFPQHIPNQWWQVPSDDPNYDSYRRRPRSFHRPYPERPLTFEERMALRQKHEREAAEVLGTPPIARDKFGRIIDSNAKRYQRKKTGSRKGKLHEGKERLPSDCEYAEWQTLNFPSCNMIHEIDLRVDFQMRKFGDKLPNMGTLDEFTSTRELDIEESEHRQNMITQQQEGYVSSGLWRNVWRIRADKQDLSPNAKFAVVKMMKQEHEVDERNWDRHRRDALVMERLTHHPNVVNIYGYCGNTVMTEYVGQTLDEILFPPNPYLKRRRPPPMDQGIEKGFNKAVVSRKTQLERLQLALDAAKGLAALHNDTHILPGGIAHADIQTKQFVVDSTVIPPLVKINDFNRCRFVAINTTRPDQKACTFRIPSAPGTSRSPEEYNDEHLTVQLDVYSLGHIFFGLLTGKDPYEGEMRGIRERVRQGIAPSILVTRNGKKKSLAVSEGIGDDAIIHVMEQSYLKDPTKRITAQGIVDYLEPVLQRMLDETSNK